MYKLKGTFFFLGSFCTGSNCGIIFHPVWKYIYLDLFKLTTNTLNITNIFISTQENLDSLISKYKHLIETYVILHFCFYRVSWCWKRDLYLFKYCTLHFSNKIVVTEFQSYFLAEDLKKLTSEPPLKVKGPCCFLQKTILVKTFSPVGQKSEWDKGKRFMEGGDS